MPSPSPRFFVVETLVLTALPVVANVLFLGDPGFATWGGFPYLVPGLLLASYYGTRRGLVQLGLGALTGYVLVPALFGLGGATVHWEPRSLGIAASLGVAGLLGLGYAANRRGVFRRRLLDRIRRSVHRIAVLQKEVSALTRINAVLEERVVNQVDSMTMLRNQIQKMASLSRDQALQTLLETVQLFTGMTSGSVYLLNPEARRLEAAATLGWQDNSFPWDVSLEASVVGYVFRNGKPFSIRMLLEGSEFGTLSLDHNLLTYPLWVHGRVWGVLNIESLPFERYSFHTESILEIILSLVEPYLADIVDYELLYQRNENDGVTGLPLVNQLYRSLDHELERMARDHTAVSVLVLEVANFEALEATATRAEAKKLLLGIKQGLGTLTTKARAFHFKNDNQLAVLVTGLDQDGTSFFALELLALVPQLGLTLGGREVSLEVIVGFATAREASTSDMVISMAENLLALQRL